MVLALLLLYIWHREIVKRLEPLNYWRKMKEQIKNCKKYMHRIFSVYILNTILIAPLSAKEVGRKPANFVPDDDAIVVPMIIEKNIINEFHEKHEGDFRSARKKLEYWISQEQYAKDYGLEDTGIVKLPTEADKERFLHRNYLRFISKDVERSTNSSLQNTWEEWTTDDEIDAIDAVELHNKVIVKAEKNEGKKSIGSSSSVKVGKDRFRFGFQLRPEIGMAKVDIKSSYFNARAWVGINGNQELKIERKFRSTGTKVFVNYYIDQTRALGVLDQKLIGRWSFRYTHDRNFEDFSNMNDTTTFENNIYQIRFSKRF